MSFYTSPSFFVLLAISIIPAAVLGFTGRRIRPYGMAATIRRFIVLRRCQAISHVRGLSPYRDQRRFSHPTQLDERKEVSRPVPHVSSSNHRSFGRLQDQRLA